MEYRLITHVKSDSEEQVRYALHNLFWNATKGQYIPKHLFPFDRLKELISSKNDKVRKWAYYVTCFYCNDEIFNEAKDDIFSEKNELIRSWMLATIYTYDIHYYKQIKGDIGLSDNSIKLLTNLFHPNGDGFQIDKLFMKSIIDGENIIDKFWFTFYYKYKPDIERNTIYKGEIPTNYIRVLTNLTSPTDTNTMLFETEEYALSALHHNCPEFSFEKNVGFDISDIEKRNCNPRKWAYTLLWKDRDFIKKNIDFIQKLMYARTLELKDREGFAKGLLENRTFYEKLGDNVVEWYLKENDPIILELLRSYMEEHKMQSKAFYEQVEINTCKNTETTKVYYIINSVVAKNSCVTNIKIEKNGETNL